MHILFLTHYFPPEVNAPASRTYENSKQWVKAGHKVTVVTCAPNHPKGILYPGYKNKFRQWDEIDGINIFRVKTYLSANKGFIKRSLNYISFLISSTFQCYKVKKVDIIVSTSPQFFCGMSGFFISRLLKRPWVLEIRDLWPESIIAVGAINNGWIIYLLEKLESFLYHKADHIVSLTNSFKTHMRKRGIPESKISVITNGADLDQFNPHQKGNTFRAENRLNGKFIVSYIGTHGMAHGLETVLKAAKILINHSEIVFLLVGDGAEKEKLCKLKDKLKLSNVIMLPQQEKEKVPEIIDATDACMVLLKKNDLFKTVIPSKIFEAMAMRRPIILGVDGESKMIIEKGDCGLCIDPENSQQLANAILKLYNDKEYCESLGDNGRKIVEDHYDRNRLAHEYFELIQSVVN